jgi:hypothetical protein
VLAPQGQGRLTDRGGVGLGQRRGRAVVGAQARFPALPEPLQQVGDGADRQAELAGELAGGPSSLSQLK